MHFIVHGMYSANFSVIVTKYLETTKGILDKGMISEVSFKSDHEVCHLPMGQLATPEGKSMKESLVVPVLKHSWEYNFFLSLE